MGHVRNRKLLHHLRVYGEAAGPLTVLLVAVAGFSHWPWWVVVAAAAFGFLCVEVLAGNRVAVFYPITGMPGVLMTLVQTIVIYGIAWLTGHGLSRLMASTTLHP